MDERTRILSARRAQDMRALQLRAERFALAMAAAEERQKAERLETETRSLETAFADWSSALGVGRFDADAMRRLSANAVYRSEILAGAELRATAAGKQRQSAAEASGAAHLRLTQASRLLGTLRRQQKRKRAEAAARDIEDRSSFARWRRA
jgi:hypothetical protein